MLDNLWKIVNEYSPLVGVSYAVFDGDPQFITAVELRFASVSAVFRAIADDDTLSLKIGTLELEPDESLITAVDSEPWASCLESNIIWAWQLINQQGYEDGVRMEFGRPTENSKIIIEFIVAASSISVFSFRT